MRLFLHVLFFARARGLRGLRLRISDAGLCPTPRQGARSLHPRREYIGKCAALRPVVFCVQAGLLLRGSAPRPASAPRFAGERGRAAPRLSFFMCTRKFLRKALSRAPRAHLILQASGERAVSRRNVFTRGGLICRVSRPVVFCVRAEVLLRGSAPRPGREHAPCTLCSVQCHCTTYTLKIPAKNARFC